MDTRQQTLLKIRNALETILGINGLNVLGEYEIIKNGKVVATVPSIQIRYPMNEENITRKMRLNSGIDCIVESEQDIYNSPNKFGHRFDKYFQVVLDQYSSKGDLTTAVEGIIASNFFDIPESPIISSARQDNLGTIPPRALLYIRQVSWRRNLFG
jgi:hypothetical protein